MLHMPEVFSGTVAGCRSAGVLSVGNVYCMKKIQNPADSG